MPLLLINYNFELIRYYLIISARIGTNEIMESWYSETGNFDWFEQVCRIEHETELKVHPNQEIEEWKRGIKIKTEIEIRRK